MTAFAEIRLNAGGGGASFFYGTSGGVEFSTNVVVMASGYEQRNQNWVQARGRWQLGERVINQVEMEYLVTFFRARGGRAQGFRWKDWSDFRFTAETLGTGDDTETDFQLVKTYTSASITQTRNLRKPVASSVQVYIDAVEQLSGWTLDSTTGIVTFSTAPTAGEVITATGEFDVPVRFDVDQFSATLEGYRDRDEERIYTLASLPIVEIRA